ncbi:SMODS domain-containing nucleotidyltransferase [Methylobacterium haplocladii]|uniref:Nucleotidyltransferase n=1 Tax=Methylobacterium haplocladii TaxID=1176176 RepID=A0A512IJG6_9HYPH|nr:nucleotidyltransferase [Methylobacterium haplocladii]GEO97839.1 hypothetical protein MHA02_02270 [Methylobacterium haplocladii]GJD82683.1 hypothetical protein HPGCJGGD_0542 [Methylobacterium haplocladii]GLS57529.1 hypothetical protein GCM10007887_01840 [Methylobacterium haplocladii]
MSGEQYLRNILAREAVDTGIFSPVRNVQQTIDPIIQEWAPGVLNSVTPSGSFAKGTAIKSGTDIDLFISLAPTVTDTLKEIYTKLAARMKEKGYSPRQQNVSIGIKVGAYDVDLVPAKQQNWGLADHSLYRRRADTWTKTNVATHISTVINCGWHDEIRLIKLWRNQKGLDFPSFYLELAVIEALRVCLFMGLERNLQTVFEYLRDRLPNARFVDPANTNNIISDDLSAVAKAAISKAAGLAAAAGTWGEVVK